MKFNETAIPATVTRLIDEKGYDFADNHVEKITNIIFNGIALFLKDAKNVKKPVAVAIEDLNSDLIFAGVVRFHEGSDGNQGSWSLSFTFDKEDLADADVKNVTDPLVQSTFASYAIRTFGMKIDIPEAFVSLIVLTAKSIKQFLDDNAAKSTEANPTQLVLDNVFVGTSGIEDGEVVKAIDVDGAIKAIIKSDDDLAV